MAPPSAAEFSLMVDPDIVTVASSFAKMTPPFFPLATVFLVKIESTMLTLPCVTSIAPPSSLA